MRYRGEKNALHNRRQGSKSAKFFPERSGGAVLAKISGAERSGGAVPSKKFGAERSGGAEISKKFDFFGVFHEFFANYCSRGTKTLTYYS